MLFHPQDISGLEPAVSRISFGESLEKRLCPLSQFQKGLPDRLQTIASLSSLEMIRVIDLFAQPCGITFMPGDEINLWGVNQDLVLRGFEGQDVGDIAGRDGVVVRLKLDIVIRSTDPKGHFGAVIGMKGQGLKHLLRKELQRGVPGRVVDMQIGLFFEPPPGHSPKVFKILEVSSIEEIAFNVFKWCLNLPLRLSPTLPTRNGLALVMGDKSGEGRIEDRPSALPAEHHGLFIIVKTFLWHPTVILKDILMSSDQAVEVTVGRKVDVLTPGEAQDIGETQHLALAGADKGDCIRTPIHLALLSWIRLKSYHRLSLRRPQLLESFPDNADSPGVTHLLEFLIDPLTRYVGILFHQLLDLRFESVKFARPPELLGQYIMSPVSPLGMGTKNPPDRVSP